PGPKQPPTTARRTAMPDPKHVRPTDLSKYPGEQLVRLNREGFLPLPPPYDSYDLEPKIPTLSEAQQQRLECDLDGISAALIPRPQTEEEKRVLVEKFLSGLKKLFTPESNWP